MSNLNQRKFPRAKFPCSLTMWQDRDQGIVMANTANIGAGGLMVYLDQGLMLGAKVDIKVDFSKGQSFRCAGTVLRCEYKADSSQDIKSPYCVAIVFEGLNDQKTDQLKAVIEKLLTQESG
ncbi:MAG: PilZ domain-containing protein [Candidatus Omnitrophica bacterium]|nr:PilZ domain-containing protein [Candidatus Omnitrophota bacterium]